MSAPEQPQAARKPPKKRATKLEQEFRRRTLFSLLKNGYGVAELRRYAREQWGMSYDASEKLVNQVMDAVVEAMSVYDLRRLASTLYLRFEHTYFLAAKAKNVGVMVSALDSMARYWLKTPPEVVITGDHGEDDDHKGDF